MKLQDAISMESFQRYLTETFPEDGKCSTSGVVHELDSTVKLRYLVERPSRCLVSCHTYESGCSTILCMLQLLPFVLGISRSASL